MRKGRLSLFLSIVTRKSVLAYCCCTRPSSVARHCQLRSWLVLKHVVSPNGSDSVKAPSLPRSISATWQFDKAGRESKYSTVQWYQRARKHRIDAVGRFANQAGDALPRLPRLLFPGPCEFDSVVRHSAIQRRIVVGGKSSMSDEDDAFRRHGLFDSANDGLHAAAADSPAIVPYGNRHPDFHRRFSFQRNLCKVSRTGGNDNTDRCLPLYLVGKEEKTVCRKRSQTPSATFFLF